MDRDGLLGSSAVALAAIDEKNVLQKIFKNDKNVKI